MSFNARKSAPEVDGLQHDFFRRVAPEVEDGGGDVVDGDDVDVVDFVVVQLDDARAALKRAFADAWTVGNGVGSPASRQRTVVKSLNDEVALGFGVEVQFGEGKNVVDGRKSGETYNVGLAN